MINFNIINVFRAIFIVSCMTCTVVYSSQSPTRDSASFDCYLTSDTNPKQNTVTHTTTFSKDTPEVILFCLSDDVLENEAVEAQWIAHEVKGVSKNYKIGFSKVTVPVVADSDDVDFKFNLTKPTKGWPVGNYRIDIYTDNKDLPVQSYYFKIK